MDLFEGAPDKKVNLAEACKEGKYVVFGVPGAFTPGCSKTHLPGYLEKAEELKGQGVKEVFCIAVNDPFVMGAWGEAHVSHLYTIPISTLIRKIRRKPLIK